MHEVPQLTGAPRRSGPARDPVVVHDRRGGHSGRGVTPARGRPVPALRPAPGRGDRCAARVRRHPHTDAVERGGSLAHGVTGRLRTRLRAGLGCRLALGGFVHRAGPGRCRARRGLVAAGTSLDTGVSSGSLPSATFPHSHSHHRDSQIPRDGAHGSNATTSGAGRFSASGTTTSRSMARARSGGNCAARATAWRAVRWAA